MAYRRIAYAALLGGAVLFQIVFRFYLSTFTLALVLLLPLLSVLLSLPSVLGCTLLLTSAAPTVVPGEDAVFQAAPACPCPGFRPVSTGATSSPARAGGCGGSPCAPHRALRPLWSWPPPTAAG